MALPLQLPTGFDGFKAEGPYRSSGGYTYYVTRDDASTFAIAVLRSANPSTTAFTQQDSAGRPTCTGTTGVSDFRVRQHGDVLHIIAISYTTPAMGENSYWCEYWTFNMFNGATEAGWTLTGGGRGQTRGEYTMSTDVSPSTQIQFAAPLVRSTDGHIVIAGVQGDSTSMGAQFPDIQLMFYNGSVWSTPVVVSSAIASGISNQQPEISDEVTSSGAYIVTWTQDGTSVHGRAITGSSHTVNTSGQLGSASVAQVLDYKLLVYLDGATWRGSAIVAQSGTGAFLNAYRFDPTSTTPFASETEESDITGADNVRAGRAYQTYDSPTDTRFVIYVVDTSPDSIKYISSINEATWGGSLTFSQPVETVILEHPSMKRLYDNVIGIIYSDSGASTKYYNEISLSVEPPFPPLYSQRPLVFIPIGG